MQPFLKSVKAIKYISRGLPAAVAAHESSVYGDRLPSVDSEELRFVVQVATGRRLTKTQTYDQLGMTRRRGKQIFDRLERKGLVRSHSFGRTDFPEVLDVGWKLLESKGFKRREPKGGGFEHEVGLDLVEAAALRQGDRFDREIDVFGRRLDGRRTDPKTGLSIFYNVGVSDPVREAQNLLQIAKMPVVQQRNKLVFVARDAAFAEQVRRTLRSQNPSGDLWKQVEIKTIADFVQA